MRGHRIAGLKMGPTARAKMKQMGVDKPIFGSMTKDFVPAPGAEVSVGRYIHPRVESEIVFVTRGPPRGPGCHAGAVFAAPDFVAAGIELLDSRYRDFKFDLNSVIADNNSAAGFVVGDGARDPRRLDLATLGVVLEKNGEIVSVGAGAAVLGNLAASVAMLANVLAERGEAIPAGSIVLTGRLTEAIPVTPDDHVRLRVQQLGPVSPRFVPGPCIARVVPGVAPCQACAKAAPDPWPIAQTRIAEIRTTPVLAPLARPLRSTSGFIDKMPLVIIDVLTDDGAEGTAYAQMWLCEISSGWSRKP